MDTELKDLMALVHSGASSRDICPSGKPYTIIPENYKLADCERLLPKPIRKRGLAVFTDAKSFTRYVNEHKIDSSRIFAQETPKVSFSAILDFHGKDASWGDHIAKFSPEFSPQWLRWTAAMGKPMTQATFAEFIERSVADIKTPQGGVVLEIAENLTAKCDVRFDQKMGVKDGKTRLVFEEDITVTGGGKSISTGSLELPRAITACIPMFVGSPLTEIQWRVRPAVRDRQLVFTIECPYLADITEIQFSALMDSIRDATGIQPFTGQFTAGTP